MSVTLADSMSTTPADPLEAIAGSLDALRTSVPASDDDDLLDGMRQSRRCRG